MMRLVFAFFWMLIFAFPAFSQDTIIGKNGKLHLCTIESQDSTMIYFSYRKDGVNIQTHILKSDIQYFKDHDLVRKKLVTGTISNGNFSGLRVIAGFCTATGDFGSKDRTQEYSGFASNGFHFGATVDLGLNKYFGVEVKGLYSTNEFVTVGIEEDMSNNIGFKVVSDIVYYQSYGFLFGPTMKVPTGKLAFSVHLLIGYSVLTQPETKFVIPGFRDWIKFEKISANAWSTNIGAELIYPIKKDWILSAGIDYFASNPEFGNLVISYYYGQPDNVTRGKQPYSVLTYSVGIGFRF
jgi:hypothetical protein